MTRYFAETHPEPFARGTAEFMTFYGTPLGGMQMQYVNGYGYNTMRPAPDEQIPERFARAEEVWPGKVWRDQLKEWDEVAKPASDSDADIVAAMSQALGLLADKVAASAVR